MDLEREKVHLVAEMFYVDVVLKEESVSFLQSEQSRTNLENCVKHISCSNDYILNFLLIAKTLKTSSKEFKEFLYAGPLFKEDLYESQMGKRT